MELDKNFIGSRYIDVKKQEYTPSITQDNNFYQYDETKGKCSLIF